jgi:hypothetical protein
LTVSGGEGTTQKRAYKVYLELIGMSGNNNLKVGNPYGDDGIDIFNIAYDRAGEKAAELRGHLEETAFNIALEELADTSMKVASGGKILLARYGQMLTTAKGPERKREIRGTLTAITGAVHDVELILREAYKSGRLPEELREAFERYTEAAAYLESDFSADEPET